MPPTLGARGILFPGCLGSAWKEWPQMCHADVSWPSSELIRFWSWPFDFSLWFSFNSVANVIEFCLFNCVPLICIISTYCTFQEVCIPFILCCAFLSVSSWVYSYSWGLLHWHMGKVLANERRCHMCDIFPHWLGPCSAIDRERALVLDPKCSGQWILSDKLHLVETGSDQMAFA